MLRYLVSAFLICAVCLGAVTGSIPGGRSQIVTITCLNGQQSTSIGAGGISQPCPIQAPYTGPVDAVAGATNAWGLRAPKTAYATGSVNAIDISNLAASTATLHYLTTGVVDVATANTLAGTDATATCTIASTTATCSSASSTPHQGDLITGAGISGPCFAVAVGTFTAGAGAVTVPATCGTVSVGETVTFEGALQITKFYDPIGSANTSGGVPAFLLTKCLNNLTVPCVASTGAQYTHATIASSSQPNSVATIFERLGLFTSYTTIAGNANNQTGFNNTANTANCFADASIMQTAADNAPHTGMCVFNDPVSSYDVVDGVNSGANTVGSGNLGTTFWLGSDASNTQVFFGVWEEIILYGNSAISPANQVILCTNQQAYAGTPAC